MGAAGSRGRAGRRAGALALTAALLSGCGITATDPIESGGPGTIPWAGSDQWLLVFLESEDKALVPVYRARPSKERLILPNAPVEAALRALSAGPTAMERGTGLRSEIPEVQHDKLMAALMDKRIVVKIPFEIAGLSDTAVWQVICTAAYAVDTSGWTEVILAGSDGYTAPAMCDAHVDFVRSGKRPELSPVPPVELRGGTGGTAWRKESESAGVEQPVG
ncbi:hypothetical protein ACWDR0_34085 [Streptomyces sp. NPDC003691]